MPRWKTCSSTASCRSPVSTRTTSLPRPTSNDISNYTNRAPYPILHLLREDSIERAVEAFPEAAEIFDKNIETMEKLGHEGWDKLDVGPAK